MSIAQNIEIVKTNIEKAKDLNEKEKAILFCQIDYNDVEMSYISLSGKATKTVSADRINYAISKGITHIGENRVQELCEKYDDIEKGVNIHLIGHLQSNKVKYIIDKVCLIHSVLVGL